VRVAKLYSRKTRIQARNSVRFHNVLHRLRLPLYSVFGMEMGTARMLRHHLRPSPFPASQRANSTVSYCDTFILVSQSLYFMAQFNFFVGLRILRSLTDFNEP
jgi:hypothetical protein